MDEVQTVRVDCHPNRATRGIDTMFREFCFETGALAVMALVVVIASLVR